MLPNLTSLETYQAGKLQQLKYTAKELNVVSLIFTIIGAMLAIVIGTSLIGTVADEAALAQNNTNITGAASTLVGLLALLFVVLIIFVAIGAYKLVT